MNLSLITPQVLRSQISLSGITTPAGAPTTVAGLVGNILNVALPLVGILFVALVVYGGASYMLSLGDPGKVKQAQSIITNAIIGLVIVALAFVVRAIVGAALGVRF